MYKKDARGRTAEAIRSCALENFILQTCGLSRGGEHYVHGTRFPVCHPTAGPRPPCTKPTDLLAHTSAGSSNSVSRTAEDCAKGGYNNDWRSSESEKNVNNNE